MIISQFAVFGERCSGTNHATAWIEQNFGWRYGPDFGWKHGAIEVPKLKKSPHTLCVLVVRNLPDWLRSLHIKPHHLSPEMRGLPFFDFIKRRVETIRDHTYGAAPGDRAFGELLTAEQKQGKPFANLIRLRRHKHRLWLKQLTELPTAIVLRHEELTQEPMQAMRKLAAVCKIPPLASIKAITTYKGREGRENFAPNSYAPICEVAMQHIPSQVDWEIETQLGYDTRADLMAARLSEGPLNFAALKEALGGNSEQLSNLKQIEDHILHQESKLRHQELVTQSQRKYLISLFHAIARSRPRFPLWPWR